MCSQTACKVLFSKVNRMDVVVNKMFRAEHCASYIVLGDGCLISGGRYKFCLMFVK